MSNNSTLQWKELIDFIHHDGKGMAILAESPTLCLLKAVNQLNLAGIVHAIGLGAQITGRDFNLLDYIATKVIREERARRLGETLNTVNSESNAKILEICLYLMNHHANLVTPHIIRKLLMLPIVQRLFIDTCIELVVKQSRDDSVRTPISLQILEDICKFELKFESLPIILLGSHEVHIKQAQQNKDNADATEMNQMLTEYDPEYQSCSAHSYAQHEFSSDIIEYGDVLMTANDLIWQHIVKHFIIPSCEIGAREETQPGKLWIDVYSPSNHENASQYKSDFLRLPRLVYHSWYEATNAHYRDKYWSIKTSYRNYLNLHATQPSADERPETRKIVFADGKHRYYNRANDTDALVKFINEFIFTVPFATLSSQQFTVGPEKISFLEFIVRSHKDHEIEISTHLKHWLAQLVVTKYWNYISQMSEEQIVAIAYLCVAELPILVLMLKIQCRGVSEMESRMGEIKSSIHSSKYRRSQLISKTEAQSVVNTSTIQQTFTTLTKLTDIVKLLTLGPYDNTDKVKSTILWQKIEIGTIEDALLIINAELVREINAEEMKIQQLEMENEILMVKLAAPPSLFVKESV